MISFIVIGKNEEKNILRCITSIKKAIEVNDIEDCEIIYVDSASEDSTVNIVKGLDSVSVFRIVGKNNAAIARNIGFEHSKGEILFFIDGDMELIPEFLPLVLDAEAKLKYDFVSGQLLDVIYEYSGRFVGEKLHDKNYRTADTYTANIGGVFLIKREIWKKHDGMKNKFRRSQDADLGLRLAKDGILLLIKKEQIAKHYSVPLNDKKRMWKMLFNGGYCYSSALLYRENLLNKYTMSRMLKFDSSFIIMLVVLMLIIITGNTAFILGYFCGVIARIYFQKERKLSNYLVKLVFFLLRDSVTLVAFILFHPYEIPREQIKYELIVKSETLNEK